MRERVELAFVAPWQNMAEKYKNLLFSYHPELAQNTAELQNLSGNHWQKILQVRPEYNIYCPWQKLSGSNWQVILEEQPQFQHFSIPAFCRLDFLRISAVKRHFSLYF